MKALVVGMGQCGGRIADEFARLDHRSRSRRHLEIVTGTYAVNTDSADLSGLTAIKRDHEHRILIGLHRTKGHGVGRLNDVASEVAREDGDKVLSAIAKNPQVYDSDVFMFITGAAGGTGSGATSVVINQVKQRFPDKPVYAIVVLPFGHEQSEQRVMFNSAVCLKSAYATADAVFLLDNQRYIQKDDSLKNNVAGINRLIVEPFYNLLCAGEEKKAKRIGAKVLDAGDIIQTLSGWTAIGYSGSPLPLLKLPFFGAKDFHRKTTEINRGIHAMDGAVSQLSVRCDCRDAERALYLLSGPAAEMSMDTVKEIGDYLRRLAPDATIRFGDYPTQRAMLDVVVIVSSLRDLAKVREYYAASVDYTEKYMEKQKKPEKDYSHTEDASGHLPVLK